MAETRKLKIGFIISCGLICFFLLFWNFVLTMHYFSFGYFDWDLAFFNQAMWNMLHGSLYSSLFNKNFLGNHANFISLLFLHLYALFPNALFLVYIKIFSFCLAAIPIFLIAKEKISARWAILFMILYFLYPPLNYALIYEFDWENLATFLIPWVFYFYYKKNFKLFVLFSLLLLTIKENMPLLIFMFAIHAILSRRKSKWYIFSTLSSVVWFFAAVFIFIPGFLGSKQHGYWAHYPIFSQRLGVAVKFLFGALNMRFLYQLFSPLAFISFLRPDILLLGAPVFLQHMLSSQYMEHTIYRNYASSMAPFIFISAIFAVSTLFKFRIRRYTRYIIAAALLICSLSAAKQFTPSLQNIFLNASNPENSRRWQMLSQIPGDASVTASFVFLAELSSRNRLYALHDIYKKAHYLNPTDIPISDYVLIDFNDIYLVSTLKQSPGAKKEIDSYLKRGNYRAISRVDNTILYKSNLKNK